MPASVKFPYDELLQLGRLHTLALGQGAPSVSTKTRTVINYPNLGNFRCSIRRP